MDRQTALEQLPARVRPAFVALWDLDLAFASVVSTTSEPQVGAIRLAWWRERLEELDQGAALLGARHGAHLDHGRDRAVPAHEGELLRRRAAVGVGELDVAAELTKWWSDAAHRDTHIVIYFLDRAKTELYFVTGVPEPTWKQGTSFVPADMEELRAAFADFHPEVHRLLQATPEAMKWPIFERDPLPLWSRGRIVLLGDACHSMKPHMGQGAAMAIEDAGVQSDRLDPSRFGVCMGTGITPVDVNELVPPILRSLNAEGGFDLAKFAQARAESIFPLWLLQHLPNMAAAHISILHHAMGPNNTIVTACAAGAQAIAGIEAGDVIVYLEREPVRTVDEVRVGIARARETLPLTLVRRGSSLEVLFRRR